MKKLIKYMLGIITVAALIIIALIFRPYEGKTITTHFSGDSIKFCITGDTGTNSNVEQDIVELLKLQKCDRIILLGDIIYPSGVKTSDDPQIEEKLDLYFKPLTQIDNTPLIAMINGNHDYSGNITEWMKAIHSRDWILMPSRYYMEDIHGFCFYYLDSNLFIRGKHRLDALPQIRWFQEERKKNQKNCHKEIVLTHHPYKSAGRHQKTDRLLELLYRWLFINQSDFLISGHSHFVKDLGKSGKTQLLISGAGGGIETDFQGGLLIMELKLKDHEVSFHFHPPLRSI